MKSNVNPYNKKVYLLELRSIDTCRYDKSATYTLRFIWIGSWTGKPFSYLYPGVGKADRYLLRGKLTLIFACTDISGMVRVPLYLK